MNEILLDEAVYEDPNVVNPIPGIDEITYLKPTIKNKNIIVGDFTYFAGKYFEKHVTHHYEHCGDKLIIGKFCQIAAGIEFVMNGANHQMNSVSTYPFFIFPGWQKEKPKISDLPIKGDTIVGNDVWIGQNVTILPGVKIGDGAIIGLGSVVSKNVDPYTVVAGNPAQVIRKRFDDELIDILLRFKWWDRDIKEIKEILPILTNSDLLFVRNALTKRM